MTTSTPEPNQPNASLTDTNLVEDRSKLSKMYQHYVEVKDKYPHALLLYRVGDFFETFFQDAVTVSRELELVLTSKHGGEVGRVAMTGVPHHAWERYTTQLVEKGYAVVICDQVEDSADAIGLVKREVTRIITPGTLLEEGMLKASRNNYISAVVIAVNLSALQFKDKNLLSIIKSALEATMMAPEYLELELTESIVMNDSEFAIANIQALKNLKLKLILSILPL